MTNDNKTGKKIAVGAVIAGVAGYLAGVLTAPKSGKETRQDISDKAVDIKDGTEQQLKNAQKDLENLLDNTKSKTVALNSKARDEYNEAIVKAKDAKHKASEVIKAVKKGSSDQPELDKALKQVNQATKNLAKYLKS